MRGQRSANLPGAKRISQLRSFALPLGAALICAALVLLAPSAGQAKDEFEDAFKYELGRIAAHGAVGAGFHILGTLLGHGHHASHGHGGHGGGHHEGCDQDHDHHHHHHHCAPRYGYTYYGTVPYSYYGRSHGHYRRHDYRHSGHSGRHSYKGRHYRSKQHRGGHRGHADRGRGNGRGHRR